MKTIEADGTYTYVATPTAVGEPPATRRSSRTWRRTGTHRGHGDGPTPPAACLARARGSDQVSNAADLREAISQLYTRGLGWFTVEQIGAATSAFRGRTSGT